MRSPIQLHKEITPNELKYKLDLKWLQSLDLEEWYLWWDKVRAKRQFVLKQSILGTYCKKRYRRELTVKERFLIKIS